MKQQFFRQNDLVLRNENYCRKNNLKNFDIYSNPINHGINPLYMEKFFAVSAVIFNDPLTTITISKEKECDCFTFQF